MGAATAVNSNFDTKRNLDNIWTELNRLIVSNKSNTTEVNSAIGSLSGSLVLDDGSNWRVTLKFYHGRLVGVSTDTPSTATASWS